MLREGRTLRELLTIAERVYGTPGNVMERQAGMLACLGALRGRPWGDTGRAEEIRRIATETLRDLADANGGAS